MLKNRKERRQERELAKLVKIAEAVLKARGVYPSDHFEFERLAGEKEAEVFYQTMLLILVKAKQIGYAYYYGYNEEKKEWYFDFVKIVEEKQNDN